MGDLVYVGSCSGTLFALDGRTGVPRWSHDVRPGGRPTSFHGDPVVVDSLLVIGTDGGTADSTFGEIIAFGLTGGRVVWKLSTTDGIVSDVVRAGDRLLAITRADSLLCLDARTGRRAWSFRGAEPSYEWAYRSPAAAHGRVFFGGSDGLVYALDLGTGRLAWSRDLRDRISTGVLALGGALYVGAGAGEVYRLGQETGAIEARLIVAEASVGPPIPVRDSLIVLAGERSMTCVDRSLTAVRWRRSVPEGLSSSRPYLWRDVVLAGSEKGELSAFRAGDGEPRWSHRLPGIIRGIGAADRVFYVGTLKGLVHAYARPGVASIGR